MQVLARLSLGTKTATRIGTIRILIKIFTALTCAGMHAEAAVMDEAFIDTRSRLIGFALDARRQRFPNEMPYHYAPFAERQDEFRWNAGTLASLKDYNLMDLSI